MGIRGCARVGGPCGRNIRGYVMVPMMGAGRLDGVRCALRLLFLICESVKGPNEAVTVKWPREVSPHLCRYAGRVLPSVSWGLGLWRQPWLASLAFSKSNRKTSSERNQSVPSSRGLCASAWAVQEPPCGRASAPRQPAERVPRSTTPFAEPQASSRALQKAASQRGRRKPVDLADATPPSPGIRDRRAESCAGGGCGVRCMMGSWRHGAASRSGGLEGCARTTSWG